MTDDEIAELQSLLNQLRTADRAAGDALFRLVLGRLEGMARKMKRRYPGLARWEETGDVLQEAARRMWQKLLRDPPPTVPLFFSDAARKIEDVLIEMLRKINGPEGPGRKIASNAPGSSSDSGAVPLYDRGSDTHDPAEVEKMAEMQRQIKALPDKEREVFDLLWYHDLTQPQAAAMLGISLRNVKLRWQRARMQLGEALHSFQGNP
jgi:RNA polymerase sigma factor (sigma-70 family)